MTSEPVGNTPRGTPIPGNAHKTRSEAAATPPVEKEPVTKGVQGQVITRKAPWYKRAARSMIADDATSVGDYILVDVFAPALRNLIRDIIVGGTDRMLYGSVRSSRRSIISDRGSIGTRYDRMSEGEPRSRALSREARATHSFDEIVLTEREEAIGAIEFLMNRIASYNVASVSDLYDYLGVTGSYADRNYGWYDLRDGDIRQTRGGYLLELPRPTLLR